MLVRNTQMQDNNKSETPEISIREHIYDLYATFLVIVTYLFIQHQVQC